MVSRNHRLNNHQIAALKEAKSYDDLAIVGMEVLKSMPSPICQVCGPISSGGFGSIKKNLEAFDKVIQKLVDQGMSVFDQMPFEDSMQRIRSLDTGSAEDTNNKLLKGFYLPIFESGLINTLYFIPGWESSHGATWERKQASRLGIRIVDLQKDFLDS
jgi:hypothetical protein